MRDYEVRLRRGRPSDWVVANPVLMKGEVGVVIAGDNQRCPFKVGDGITPWTGLPYATALPSVLVIRNAR